MQGLCTTGTSDSLTHHTRCDSLHSALPEDIAHTIYNTADQVAVDSAKVALQKYRSKEPSTRKILRCVFDEVESSKKRRIQDKLEGKSESGEQSYPAAQVTNIEHCFLTLPYLTEAEEASSLGTTLGSLMDTLKTLEEQLLRRRTAIRHIGSTPTHRNPTNKPNGAVSGRNMCHSLRPTPALDERVIERLDSQQRPPEPNLRTSSSSGTTQKKLITQHRPSHSMDDTIDLGSPSMEASLDADDDMFSYLKSL